MVEPIPFLGLFDDEEPVSYLRKQLEIQQELISSLQASLIKAQAQLLDQATGWEMIKNPDGSFTLRPFPADQE
jgi:capsule polysaccharide export protein KpsE/RkpR